MSILWVIIAGFFDLLTLIPTVGTFLGTVFWVLLGVYFWKKGVGIINGKRIATGLISIVIEAIPAAQFLPAITTGVVIVLVLIRIEDKTGISLVKPLKKGVTPPRIRATPLNSTPGIRPPRRPPPLATNQMSRDTI